MQRWDKLLVVTVLLSFTIGLSSGAVALGTNDKDCVLLFNQFMTLEPENATLTPGQTLTAHIEVFAKQGDWDLIVNAQTESLGFVADGANFWEVKDGEKRVLDARIRITDVVEPGVYPLRFIVSATPLLNGSCDRFRVRTSIFSTDVRIKGIRAVEVSDGVHDVFDAQTGERVDLSGVFGVDIQEVGVERTDEALVFAVQTDGRLPAFVDDAPQRVGCYLDVDGNASLGAPFDPQGFEFLVLTSWHPQDPFAQLIELGSGETRLGLSSRVTLNSLFMSVDLAALGSPPAVGWACFSEYTDGAIRAVDLVSGQSAGAI